MRAAEINGEGRKDIVYRGGLAFCAIGAKFVDC